MVLQSENAFLTLPNGQETKKIRLAAGYFLFLTASRFPFDWKFVFRFALAAIWGIYDGTPLNAVYGLQEEISEVAKKKTQALEPSELTGYGSKESFPGWVALVSLI